VAGLILAGFIGGAIRTLLSSDKIQNRILTELQAALPALQRQNGSGADFTSAWALAGAFDLGAETLFGKNLRRAAKPTHA